MYGVARDLPRSLTAHVYQCSIFMGKTEWDEEDFASMLHELAQDWVGCRYDLLAYNCCGFASALCERLGVGKLPQWVDRVPRLLRRGRSYGREAIMVASKNAKAVGDGAMEIGNLAKEGVRVVHRMSSKFIEESDVGARKFAEELPHRAQAMQAAAQQAGSKLSEWGVTSWDLLNGSWASSGSDSGDESSAKLAALPVSPIKAQHLDPTPHLSWARQKQSPTSGQGVIRSSKFSLDQVGFERSGR